MITRMFRQYGAVLSLVMLLSAPGFAQSGPTELRVGVYPVAPFAMPQNGSLTGFSIELWNNIAARLAQKTNYQIAAGTTALFEDMRSKTLDMVVTPVFVTSVRDTEFDFSFPVLDAGLGILVRDTGDSSKPANPCRSFCTCSFRQRFSCGLALQWS